MDEHEAFRLIGRLCLQAKAQVDVPHGKLKHLRLVGFVIEPDELYKEGEGILMLAALQRAAELDLGELQAKLEGCMNRTVDFPGIGQAHA